MCLLGLILIIVSFSSTAIYAQNFQPADPGSGVGDNPSTAVLTSPGRPFVWGDNSLNQLGNVGISNSATAREVEDLSGPINNVSAIAGGSFHSAAVMPDSSVRSWGWNAEGQLGNPTVINHSAVSVPVVDVNDDALNDVIAIASADEHNLTLKSDGTVWAWGRNAAGQLGIGTNNNSLVAVQVINTDHSPFNVNVTGHTGPTAVASGWYHSLVLKSDGTVWAFGWNDSGQLGTGNYIWSSFPVQVTDLTNVIAIAAGEEHSLALKSDGTVWAWGKNSGQLGIGNPETQYKTSPVQVTGLSGVTVTAIAAGFEYSMALVDDGTGHHTGTVWSWGVNHNGELGYGNFNSSPGPAQVTGLNGVTAIAANFEHSLALKSDRSVWAWGLNDSGQLGNGGNTNSNAPVQVIGPNGAPLGPSDDIAAGAHHSLAIVSNSLAINTALLPNGALGQPYSATLTASGGSWSASNYTWSIDSSSLNQLSTYGLTLHPNGLIDGSPTAMTSGSVNIVFKVTDSTSATATKTLSITIGAFMPTISSISKTSGDTGTSVDINGTGFTGATSVKFGNTAAASFTINSGIQITAVVGTGSTGHVSVTTPGGTATSSDNFNYIVDTTTTAVISSSNTSTSGQQVTFTATVSHTSGTVVPTGTVIFKDGSITVGTGNLSSAQATFATAVLGIGSHAITAEYQGDNSYSGSTSSPLTQTVNSAPVNTGGGGGGATPSADLSIAINSSSPVKVGSAITYTINVINAGPSTATSITVTDILPAGVTFVSASGDAWNFSQQATTLSFTRASLPVGSAPAITVNVTATAAGTISNSATVVASQSDSNSTNNTATTSTTVTAATPTATPTPTSTPTPTTTQSPSPTPSATTSPVPTTTTSTPTTTVPTGTTIPSSTPGETGSGVQPWVIVIIVVVAIAIVLAIVLMIMRRRREV
jgi:uncharacterized repeat protein (TIGR01451 family)